MCTSRPSIFAPERRPTAACAASYNSTGAGTSVTTAYMTPLPRDVNCTGPAPAVASAAMIAPPARDVQPLGSRAAGWRGSRGAANQGTTGSAVLGGGIPSGLRVGGGGRGVVRRGGCADCGRTPAADGHGRGGGA